MSFLRRTVRHLIFAALLLAPDLQVVYAAPPEGYYAGIEDKTGGELKQALHQIIRRDHFRNLPHHTVTEYGALMTPLRAIWKDPANPQNILLAYSSPSVPAFAATWNREHLWPRSRGNTDQLGPDDSDLFHVVPSDTQVNALRSSRYFDWSDPNDPSYVIPASSSAPQASYDSNSWQPAPDERGDIARAMLYMDVRYNGSEAFTTDLELVAFAPAGAQMGHLNTLLLSGGQCAGRKCGRHAGYLERRAIAELRRVERHGDRNGQHLRYLGPIPRARSARQWRARGRS